MKRILSLTLLGAMLISSGAHAKAAKPAIDSYQELNYELEQLAKRYSENRYVIQISVGGSYWEGILGTTNKYLRGSVTVSWSGIESKMRFYGKNDISVISLPKKRGPRSASWGYDNMLWAVQTDGTLEYRWKDHDDRWRWFKPAVGKAKSVSVGENSFHTVFMIGKDDGKIYYFPHGWQYPPKTEGFSKWLTVDIPGKFRDVKVTADRFVFFVSEDGKIFQGEIDKDVFRRDNVKYETGADLQEITRIPFPLYSLQDEHSPNKPFSIAAANKIRIFCKVFGNRIYAKNAGMAEWTNILHNFRSVDIALDGTFLGIGNDWNIYVIYQTFYEKRTEMLNKIRHIDDLRALAKYYSDGKHLKPFKKYTGESPFMKQYAKDAWIAFQGDSFSNDIKDMKPEEDEPIARKRLVFLERLCRRYRNRLDRSRTYEALQDEARAKIFEDAILKIYEHRNELIKYDKDKTDLTEQALREGSREVRSVVRGLISYVEGSPLPKVMQDRILKEFDDILHPPELPISLPVSLINTFERIRKMYKDSAHAPVKDDWPKDYEKRSIFVEMVRYLAYSMFAPDILKLHETSPYQSVSDALKLPETSSLKKLFTDMNKQLDRTPPTLWAANFLERERTDLKRLVKIALNKIAKEEAQTKAQEGVPAEPEAEKERVSERERIRTAPAPTPKKRKTVR